MSLWHNMKKLSGMHHGLVVYNIFLLCHTQFDTVVHLQIFSIKAELLKKFKQEVDGKQQSQHIVTRNLARCWLECERSLTMFGLKQKELWIEPWTSFVVFMGHSPPFHIVQFGRMADGWKLSHTFVELWSSTFLQRKNLNRPMGRCSDASFDNDQLALFAITFGTSMPHHLFSFSSSNSSRPLPPELGRMADGWKLSHTFVELWSSTFLQRKNLNRPMGRCSDASFDKILF